MKKESKQSNISNKGQSKAFYDNHIDEIQVSNGLASGTYFKGLLRVNPQRRKVAYISVEGIKFDIVIVDEKDRNRAVHGDCVVVELYPDADWLPRAAAPKESNKANDGLEDSNNATSIQTSLWNPVLDLLSDNFFAGVDVEADGTRDGSALSECMQRVTRISLDREIQPRGKVVAISVSKHKTTHIGSLQAQCALVPGQRLPESQTYVFFNPSDARYPNMIVDRIELPMGYINNPHAEQSQIYIAEMAESWPSRSKFPAGVKVRSIGEMGSIAAETEALLIVNGCNHSPFTDETVLTPPVTIRAPC